MPRWTCENCVIDEDCNYCEVTSGQYNMLINCQHVNLYESHHVIVMNCGPLDLRGLSWCVIDGGKVTALNEADFFDWFKAKRDGYSVVTGGRGTSLTDAAKKRADEAEATVRDFEKDWPA